MENELFKFDSHLNEKFLISDGEVFYLIDSNRNAIASTWVNLVKTSKKKYFYLNVANCKDVYESVQHESDIVDFKKLDNIEKMKIGIKEVEVLIEKEDNKTLFLKLKNK
jgi:hypothetical protein